MDNLAKRKNAMQQLDWCLKRIAELEAQRDDYGDDAAQLRAKNSVLIEERDALRDQLAEARAENERLQADYDGAVMLIQEIVDRVKPLLPVALAGGEG